MDYSWLGCGCGFACNGGGQRVTQASRLRQELDRGHPVQLVISARNTVTKSNTNNLLSHILPTSATMVGVCMTVISIVKLFHPGTAGRVIDKILAIDSVPFLASAIISYISIVSVRDTTRLERAAEKMFLLGLGVVAIVAVILAFELM